MTRGWAVLVSFPQVPVQWGGETPKAELWYAVATSKDDAVVLVAARMDANQEIRYIGELPYELPVDMGLTKPGQAKLVVAMESPKAASQSPSIPE